MTTRERLIKRLNWYYPTEKFNAFLFTGAIIFVSIKYPLTDSIFLLYGLLVMVVILFQGQHYWKLKLYRLTSKPFDQWKNLELFRKAKRLNMIMIGIIPLALFVQLFLADWIIKSDKLFLLAVAANVFGILEHINYYHKQLMIDNSYDIRYIIRNKKLKTASLRKDLNENHL